MTLCISWLDKNGQVHFLSDSRATLHENNFFDFTVKISAINVKILGPINQTDKYPDQWYDLTLGVCVSGSVLNAFSIIENTRFALNSLQVIPGITDVSMDQLCNIIKKYYSNISDKLVTSLGPNGVSEFFLTGYCPTRNKIRTFKFHLDTNSIPFQPTFTEILLTPGREIIGSGKSKALSLFSDPNKNEFYVMKEVINDNTCGSVGGSLQYGSIKGQQFKVYGIKDFIIDEDKKSIKIKYLLQGYEMGEWDFIVKYDEFHLMKTFISPFESEIEKYLPDYRVI